MTGLHKNKLTKILETKSHNKITLEPVLTKDQALQEKIKNVNNLLGYENEVIEQNLKQILLNRGFTSMSSMEKTDEGQSVD